LRQNIERTYAIAIFMICGGHRFVVFCGLRVPTADGSRTEGNIPIT
jgi:hypothetical protein